MNNVSKKLVSDVLSNGSSEDWQTFPRHRTRARSSPPKTRWQNSLSAFTNEEPHPHYYHVTCAKYLAFDYYTLCTLISLLQHLCGSVV